MSVLMGESINFHSPLANKPANLQHSAVLRFLEEEEQRKRGGSPSNLKRVAWPPPPEAEGHLDEISLQDALTEQHQPAQNQVPQQQRQAPAQQRQGAPQQQQQQQQQQRPTQYYQPVAKPVEPPPTNITLRSEAPVSQTPNPLITSQPATATLKGGKNLRGDLKWPPPETRERMAEENRLRLELAKGPVCRPRKVPRDYTGFFAQHALGDTYPRYHVPPGTQFYFDQTI